MIRRQGQAVDVDGYRLAMEQVTISLPRGHVFWSYTHPVHVASSRGKIRIHDYTIYFRVLMLTVALAARLARRNK